MGKSGPNATFNLIFLGLGWPWVGEFDGFIVILSCFSRQHHLVYRKITLIIVFPVICNGCRKGTKTDAPGPLAPRWLRPSRRSRRIYGCRGRRGSAAEGRPSRLEGAPCWAHPPIDSKQQHQQQQVRQTHNVTMAAPTTAILYNTVQPTTTMTTSSLGRLRRVWLG